MLAFGLQVQGTQENQFYTPFFHLFDQILVFLGFTSEWQLLPEEALSFKEGEERLAISFSFEA